MIDKADAVSMAFEWAGGLLVLLGFVAVVLLGLGLLRRI